MSLPVVSGKGFLISDGVELKFSASGNAWARLPLSFRNNKKDPNTGNWSHDKEILVEATVFGPLAEYLADNVEGRTDIHVTGEMYTEDYEAKDGTTRTSIRMNVLSAAPAGRPRVAAAAGASRAADTAPF